MKCDPTILSTMVPICLYTSIFSRKIIYLKIRNVYLKFCRTSKFSRNRPQQKCRVISGHPEPRGNLRGIPRNGKFPGGNWKLAPWINKNYGFRSNPLKISPPLKKFPFIGIFSANSLRNLDFLLKTPCTVGRDLLSYEVQGMLH